MVKFGTPVQWSRATETYLETAKHKCKMEYKDLVLYVTNEAQELLLVPVGNIAYMQAKESGKKTKEPVVEQAVGQ